jgi:hypothetical protein
MLEPDPNPVPQRQKVAVTVPVPQHWFQFSLTGQIRKPDMTTQNFSLKKAQLDFPQTNHLARSIPHGQHL